MKGALSMSALLLTAVAWSSDIEPPNARLARATSRCTAAAELIACADALNLNPNDVTLLVAEGDALVRQRRPGEAIGVFRNALKQSAGAISVQDKIAAAQVQRHVLLDTCEIQEGDIARSACEAAWLPGSPDEAAVFQRRGYLFERAGQLTPALDAYLAAARLRPAERSVAQSVLRLSERTGREDAATLSARGQALLTLGHPTAALLPLRRALKMSPDFAEAKARLKIAEREQSEQVAAATMHAAPSDAVSVQPTAHFSNEEPLTRSN